MNKIIKTFLDEGYLISPDVLGRLNSLDFNNLFELVNKRLKEKNTLIFDEELMNFLVDTTRKAEQDASNANFTSDVLDEEHVESNSISLIKPPSGESLISQDSQQVVNGLVLLKNYQKKAVRRDVQDFVQYYRARYNSLKKFLMNRPELQDVISINRALNKKEKEKVSLIGLVVDKNYTKNDNLMLTLEDITGCIKILVNKGNPIFNSCKDIVLDEIIGVSGVTGNKIVFVNSVFFPYIPLNKSIKKSNEKISIAFISDIHVGSTNFLKENFLKFISWLNGEIGSSKQKELAKTVKYLLIVGDTVDGIGIYPGQDQYLNIKDIVEQYKELATMLGSIRKDVVIIICGGQHDALRLAEPQPKLDETYAADLLNLPNLIAVSNPSLITVGKNSSFEGFNILMYHGASFHYYHDNVDSLRSGKANLNPSLILHYLLQKRHLAPTHGSTSFIPDPDEDPLVIDKVPDVFVSGEMHRTDVSNFNNVITINCSCWQSRTPFEEKVGNEPDPCKVPILNLKTREIRIMNFS